MLSRHPSLQIATIIAAALLAVSCGRALAQATNTSATREPSLFSQIGWTKPGNQTNDGRPPKSQPYAAQDVTRPETLTADPETRTPSHSTLYPETGGEGTIPDFVLAPTQNPSSQLLTLAAIVEMALAAHPALGEAAARVQAAQGRWLQSGLPFNPEIGFSGDQLGSGGLAEQYGIVLGKKFIRGGKLELSRAVECEEIHLRNAELVRQEQRVITDVRIAFYQVLAAERRLNLARQLNDINSQALKAAESLVRVKEGSKVDVLQAEIELETVAAALHQAEFEFAGAWRRLATVAGQPDLGPQPLDGSLEANDAPLVFDDVWRQLEAESPEILLAQIAVEKACRQLQRQQVESVPDVNVQAVLQHDNGTGGIDGNLQVMFPLRTANRNQGGIQEAAAKVMAARQALDRKRLELRAKLAEVFAQYETARDQASHYRETILPKAAENLELVRHGYEAGEFSFIQVLVVQRTYAEKNSIYLKSLGELWTRKLEIDGLLLKDSLGDFE